MLLGQKTGSNKIEFMFDSNGEYYGFEYNNTQYFYIKNLQGDVVGIANTAGEQIATYLYDAYGRNLIDNSSNTLAQINPIRYRGYYYDTETGFYYLNSRYYAPELCRFISPDEPNVVDAVIDSVTDKNLFSYCDNNPVVRKDEGGNFWDTVFDVISLCSSVVEVAINPTNVFSWIGLAADITCLVTPGLTGGSAIVKVISKSANAIDTAKDMYKAADKANDIRKATGFYEITYKSGKNYVGKGGFKRMITSMEKTRYIDKTNNVIDEVVSATWRKAPNHKAAFLGEYFLQTKRGVLNSSKEAFTYNVIWSPGKKYYNQMFGVF